MRFQRKYGLRLRNRQVSRVKYTFKQFRISARRRKFTTQPQPAV